MRINILVKFVHFILCVEEHAGKMCFVEQSE